MVAAFAINEQFDKILLSKLRRDIAEAEVGVYSACYNWVCLVFCIEQPIPLELNHSFSAILMIKCTANLRDGNKYFVIFDHLYYCNRFC
jgi:hypothetical protein